ncbi:MAG: PhzF family phenazine biosynthesis protein, partial [Leadbetterella sp.]
MNIKTFIVDAFTDTPFKGNPAGVCLLKEDLDESTMLSIAKELGLSETAFIKKNETENFYTIRYFSPKMEIPLCGHATMASSKVLFYVEETLKNIIFKNIQNIDLFISKTDDDEIVMKFPIYGTIPATYTNELIESLRITKIKNCEYNAETNILILEIEDSTLLRNLKPDFDKLYRSHNSINGVLVTSPSQIENYDFESRYFWP